MSKTKIYLIGAMTHYVTIGENDRMYDWRDKAKTYLNEINIDVFDPSANFINNCRYDSKSILPQNKFYARECQMAIANLEYLEHSGGSVWEFGAFSIQDKPIIAFGKTKWESVAHVRDAISIKFDTLNEVFAYIHNMYGQ
jgi:nucleoside 2-deoxyribosyltransferase